MLPGSAGMWMPYNDSVDRYNAAVANSHIMTVSRNGQVSIPASARSRWKTRRVVVVDVGDRVIVRPVGDDPIGEMRGKHQGGISSDEMRRQARAEEEERERNHT